MTYGPGWVPPPPPPPPPKRFAGKWIWLGVGVGIAATLVSPLPGVAVGRIGNLGAIGAVLLGVGGLVPLVIGIVLTAMEGTPRRRGLGLGMLIGWGLTPIVFAGLCLVIIIGAYSQTGS